MAVVSILLLLLLLHDLMCLNPAARPNTYIGHDKIVDRLSGVTHVARHHLHGATRYQVAMHKTGM